MDTAQWPQEIVVKPLEEIVTNTASCPKPNSSPDQTTKQQRPHQKEQALNCPRCNSTNTKFCYYNNYSLSQPRYFCKTCRRYWTAGGSLRNIPFGGGSRKNKRSSSSKSNLKLPDLVTHQNPTKIGTNYNNVADDGRQDLNLAFPASHDATTSANAQLSALELITGISSRGVSSFIPIGSVPDPNPVYASWFNPMQELMKPGGLSFSMDGIGSGYGSLQEANGSLLFPFEDLKQVSTSTSNNSDADQSRGENKQGDDSSAGYWTGMLGGGSW